MKNEDDRGGSYLIHHGIVIKKIRKVLPVRGKIMRIRMAVLILVMAAGMVMAEECNVVTQIIPPGAVVEKVAGDFKFTEGPAWDYKGTLYFSDIPNNRIIRFAGGKCDVWRENSGAANGLMFDAQKRMIVCEGGARRVARCIGENQWETVAGSYNGKKLNSPNDLAIDAKGRIYFTDPRYGKQEGLEQDKESVYRVDTDGKVTRIIDDTKKCNGIGISPDGRTLYIVDNGAGELRSYPLKEDGSVDAGKTIASTPGGDGMCLDEKGNLYVTSKDGVRIFDKEGKQIGLIPVPEVPANCVFGGEKLQTLYITARTSLYKIDLNARGWQAQLDGEKK